jgi:hypothetical protein
VFERLFVLFLNQVLLSIYVCIERSKLGNYPA